jgi:anaerobic glycerol-3-phosphate dehydrogenase
MGGVGIDSQARHSSQPGFDLDRLQPVAALDQAVVEEVPGGFLRRRFTEALFQRLLIGGGRSVEGDQDVAFEIGQGDVTDVRGRSGEDRFGRTLESGR